MKIPETSNVGAYYGNEENGQWQPNGVIIDNGVGGGVVGSGDAGVHRPPVYPVHMPRGPMPGYVMAGAYYPAAYPAAAAPQDDFADYMWMENEEEFDKQVMQQLEEEALMEQCIEAMLEDEQRERHRPVTNGHNNFATTSNGTNSVSLQEAVSRSTLNPLAAEFVPSRARQPPEEKQDPPETKEDSDKPKEDIQPSSEAESQEKIEVTEVKKEESSPQTETPEVSAADVQPIDETDAKSKEKPKQGKTETKKPARAADAKPKPRREAKAKSAPCDQQCEGNSVKSVQSEVRSVKSEVKSVKSEVKLSDDEKEDGADVLKQTSPPPSDEPASGVKPINYAAAARANKAKKSTTPPAADKPTPPAAVKADKPKEKAKDKLVAKTKTDKAVVKADKPIQRKSSTK